MRRQYKHVSAYIGCDASGGPASAQKQANLVPRSRRGLGRHAFVLIHRTQGCWLFAGATPVDQLNVQSLATSILPAELRHLSSVRAFATGAVATTDLVLPPFPTAAASMHSYQLQYLRLAVHGRLHSLLAPVDRLVGAQSCRLRWPHASTQPRNTRSGPRQRSGRSVSATQLQM